MSTRTRSQLRWSVVPLVGISGVLAFVFSMNATYPYHGNATGLAKMFNAQRQIEASQTTATSPATTQVVASDTEG